MQSLRQITGEQLAHLVHLGSRRRERRKTTRVYPELFARSQSVFVFARSNKSREERGNIGSDCFGETLLYPSHRDGAGQWNFG